MYNPLWMQDFCLNSILIGLDVYLLISNCLLLRKWYMEPQLIVHKCNNQNELGNYNLETITSTANDDPPYLGYLPKDELE